MESIEDVPIDILYILVFVLVTVVALGFGIFAHLWEDSTTVSGIRWFPTKNRVSRGHLRVGGKNEEAVFIAYAGIGVIITLLEMLYARDDLLLQLLFSIGSFGLFILGGVVLRHPLFMRVFGEDILLKDIQTRRKAEKNSVTVDYKGKSLQIERDRIKRGLKLAAEFESIGTLKKRTGHKIIDRGEGIFHCSCKDFKIINDLTICKHLVAYIVLKTPTIEEQLAKLIQP
jgi:hypothetical protein